MVIQNGTIEECYCVEHSPFQAHNTQDAGNSPDAQHWEEAIQEEMLSVNSNKTLSDPTRFPEGKRPAKHKSYLCLRRKAPSEIQHIKRISTV